MAEFSQTTSAWNLVLDAQAEAGLQGPMTAMLEVADRCNEVCLHCYQVQGQKGEISTEQWKRILDELAELGVFFVTFSGGEATLRSDLLELIAHARGLKFAVKLYTNGQRMDAAYVRRLSELAVQEVQLSLYSVQAETHDTVTGVKGSFERTVNAVRLLAAEGVATVIKTPAMSLNVGQRAAYMQLASELGADFSFDPSLSTREDGVRDPESLSLGPADMQQLHVELGRPPAQSFEPATQVEASLEQRPCGPCSEIHIEANGAVQPCTMMDVTVAEATAPGWVQQWQGGDKAQAVRSLDWSKVHGCRDCDLRSACAHCFADAKRQVGDALAPYATACSKAVLTFERRTGSKFRLEGGDDGDAAPTPGPYRCTGENHFERISDVQTEEDRARARRYSWLRGEVQEPAARAETDGLVQLRRPGRSTTVSVQIPDRPIRQGPGI